MPKTKTSLSDLIGRYERFMALIARDWARCEADVEDLIQAARVSMWRGHLISEADHAENYYKQRIRWAIQDEAKRLYREPAHESLDENLL